MLTPICDGHCPLWDFFMQNFCVLHFNNWMNMAPPTALLPGSSSLVSKV